jgi:hypothetical protein
LIFHHTIVGFCLEKVILRQSPHLPQGEITYTCVPPGSGWRIGLDRDEDGILDGNDHDTRRGATTQ